MLTRICLIVAIVAGLTTAGIGFVKVREHLTTAITERDREYAAKIETMRQLDETNQILVATSEELELTKGQLATARENLQQQIAKASAQETRANRLADELQLTKADLAEKSALLEQYLFFNLTPQQVGQLNDRVNSLVAERDAIEEEKKVLTRTITRLDNKIKELTVANYKVPLPEGLKGNVLVVDPKWDFVVLDIGEEQGVLENGEMLVNRNGRLVAKVRIKTVERSRSIANVLPGWKLGDVMEGDEVLY